MVSGSKRNPAFPDVPSAAEVGLPDYTVTTWYGLWAPKGTPADAQARIVDEVRKAVQSEELKAIWASQGAEFPNLTPAAVRRLRDRRSSAGPPWSRPRARSWTDRSPMRGAGLVSRRTTRVLRTR